MKNKTVKKTTKVKDYYMNIYKDGDEIKDGGIIFPEEATRYANINNNYLYTIKFNAKKEISAIDLKKQAEDKKIIKTLKTATAKVKKIVAKKPAAKVLPKKVVKKTKPKSKK